MNIGDLNRKIYGYNDLGEGEYVENILKSLESQQLEDFYNLDYENKQIKF